MTNCPPIYRNIQCESFSNKRKITSQMLRQFCKNDAYLYEQIMALWDATDPESRKRFYPPDFMDVAHSFGIESHILADYEAEEFNYWNTVYRFDRTTKLYYIFDFNSSNDRVVEYDGNGQRLRDGEHYYSIVYADSFLDIENSYNMQMLEIVNEDGVTTVRPPISTSTYKDIVHHNETYSTKKANTGTKYVTKQTEKLGKAKKDAHFYGAFNNWNCNNHWYNGFDRTKNYSIKSKWRKDQDTYDIPSVCHAQTFKAESSGRLSKVNLNVQGDKNAVSPCIVEIRETSAKGYPTTKVLARTEKKFSGKGENIVAFEFKTKAKVTKGKTYAIVLRSPLSKFSNTYRWGGWTTGCFSSESKYYGNGSAFTSTDNGKSWVKNGKTKDTKSYGSHYYDWGINQKPVDFAFEVFVQPITEKAIKQPVTTSNASELVAQGYFLYKDGTYKKVEKEAYDEIFTYEYSYIKEGSYYLHLKPIRTNPIDSFKISSMFTDNQTPSQWWTWEYYNHKLGEWVEIVGDNTVDYDNNTTNYTVLKLRIRCDVESNTYIGTTDNISDNVLDDLLGSEKLVASSLTYLKSATLLIESFKPTKGYLRTLYYHPTQEGMLGASIWSEIGVNAQAKGDATLEIDVIHEGLATEHFKFYDLNILTGADMENLTELQEDIIADMSLYINQFVKGDDVTSYTQYTAEGIQSYVYEDMELENGEFIEYLKSQLTPVYILPLYYDGARNPTIFFDKLQLPHLPSYPLNACEIGDDDIILDEDRFTGLSNYGFYYPLNKSIRNTLSSIDLTYTTPTLMDDYYGIDVDEEGFELGSVTEERISETLKGVFLDKKLDECLTTSGFVKSDVFSTDLTINSTNYTSIDYAVTSDGKAIIFSRNSKLVQTIFPNLATGDPYAPLASVDNGNVSINNAQLKVNLTTKSYQEFIDFEVDYDEGTIDFYNQLKLIHGDFNITYNPLWVRGLSVADFPLKMDLWKEHYRVGVGTDNSDGIFKRKYDVDRGAYVDDSFFGQTTVNPVTQKADSRGRSFYTFKTTVAPRDNIRKLVINEGTTDERTLVEDSQFFVDYLKNEVVLYISTLEENDTLTIHYTPNLTDGGLALAYRIKRGRYIEDVPSTDDDLNAEPRDVDDIYIGRNYFTYRT